MVAKVISTTFSFHRKDQLIQMSCKFGRYLWITYFLFQMQYPFLLFQKTNLPAERWKDIPGFEHYYQVSNKGRVRSLDRYVNHKSGRPVLIKGQILKQTIYKYRNKTVHDHIVALRVALSIDNKRYDFQVRRLVYEAFKGAIKPGFNVVNKNGDGYSNMPLNLDMISTTEKQKRSINKGRQIPSLKYLDRSKFKKSYGGYSRQKEITQTSMDGKFSKTYLSIRSAAKETGVDQKAIINCAKGRRSQHKGFKWEYTKQESSRKSDPNF